MTVIDEVKKKFSKTNLKVIIEANFNIKFLISKKKYYQ